MGDEGFACLMAGRLRPPPPPACSRMQVVSADWLYPVKGYCKLAADPGRYRIPSVEEFHRFCTSPRFQECPRFRVAEQTLASLR